MTQADTALALTCSGCGRTRPRGWFARAGAGRDGKPRRASWCRECRAPQRARDGAVRRERMAGPGWRDPGTARLLAAQGYRCPACGGALLPGDRVHRDHIVPLARGGTHSAGNVRLVHAACNLKRGARLIGERGAM